MKTFVRIIASLSVILGAAACQQYQIDTQMTPEKAAAGIRLVCDALSSYSVAATNPGNVSFNISSNTPWTITRSSGADWVTVTPSSSAASALISDVVISFENNTSSEDRSATLTLTGENISGTTTITITQDRLGRLYVTPVAQNYAAAGGPLSFKINTNQDWEVRSDVSWLSFNRENGTPDPDGLTMTVIATAEANEGIARTATVTVTAGDDEESFDVTQNGFTFEIVTPASTELPRLGGSLTIEVNTSATWTPATDNADWTVEKTDASHFKVTAPANGGFVPKTGKVSISTPGGAYDELELSQDINFTFSGNYEILADGSVKLSGGAKSVITTRDTYRYIRAELKLKDVHMAANGEMWFYGKVGECNIYNQITLGGNQRTRTDGNNAAGNSTYKSTSYDAALSEAEFAAMTSYGINITPDAGNLKFEFLYNGESRGSQTGVSAFDGTTDGTAYSFGFWNTGDANTYYTVTSFDITAVEE